MPDLEHPKHDLDHPRSGVDHPRLDLDRTMPYYFGQYQAGLASFIPRQAHVLWIISSQAWLLTMPSLNLDHPRPDFAIRMLMLRSSIHVCMPSGPGALRFVVQLVSYVAVPVLYVVAVCPMCCTYLCVCQTFLFSPPTHNTSVTMYSAFASAFFPTYVNVSPFIALQCIVLACMYYWWLWIPPHAFVRRWRCQYLSAWAPALFLSYRLPRVFCYFLHARVIAFRSPVRINSRADSCCFLP